jgi:NAD(P)H-hydrate epimerase
MKQIEYLKSDISELFRPREEDTNKADYGRFLVIGGTPGMSGALKLAVQSCYRAGAGLVYYTAPKEHLVAYDALVTEGITVALEDLPENIMRKDCICIGCGLKVTVENSEMFEFVLFSTDCPLVVDAGALQMLAGRKDLLKLYGPRMIILPHPGEMSVLTGISIPEIQKNRVDMAMELSQDYGCITVLKGHDTIVTDGERVYINKTGNAGMATAGAGDVLAGIVTAYTKMFDDRFTAACMAVYVHGLAGDYAKKDLGEISMCAGDISECISKAHKEIMNGKTR